MKLHPATWAARAIWLSLPFTVGNALGSALAERSTPVQTTVTIGAWIAWGVTFLALMVPSRLSLTVVRIAGPASVVVAGWAAWSGDGSGLAVLGVVAAAVAAVLMCTGYVADDFVDASSYGDERRFSLRAPGYLLLAAIPVAWVVCVAGLVVGPLLVAAEVWVPGAIALAVGWTLAFLSARSIHALSCRFVVFVPAGVTLVDPMVLVDAVLFPKRTVVAFGPAPVDGESLDLSQQAIGLALEIALDAPTGMAVKRSRTTAEEVEAARVVFTPARPAAVLSEAVRRGL